MVARSGDDRTDFLNADHTKEMNGRQASCQLLPGAECCFGSFAPQWPRDAAITTVKMICDARDMLGYQWTRTLAVRLREPYDQSRQGYSPSPSGV